MTEKINELKNTQMSKEETIKFLENMANKMKDDSKKIEKSLQVLKDDYEGFLKTGKMWEPLQGEMEGKTHDEILELFIKNRPRI